MGREQAGLIMGDDSVSRKNVGGQRMADALLRATGASSATVLLPSTVSDQSDAAQLGIDNPNYQSLSLAPVIFRRTRATMQQGQPARYEMLISAATINSQIGALNFDSASAFFEAIAAVSSAGLNLMIQNWSCSTDAGQPTLYRLVLTACEPLKAVSGS